MRDFCFVLTGFSKFIGKSGSPEHVEFFLGAIYVLAEKAYKVDIIPFPLSLPPSLIHPDSCQLSILHPAGSGNIAPGQRDTARGQTVWCPQGLVTTTPNPC